MNGHSSSRTSIQEEKEMTTLQRVPWAALITPLLLLVAGCASMENKEMPLAHVSTPFDKAAAMAALAPRGRATVEGVACVYHGQEKFLARNFTVYLYPATPFFNELFTLWTKEYRTDEPQEVHDARIYTQTDGQGRFRFTGIRPGKYHLYMYMQFKQIAERDVYAGYSDTPYGEVDHYQRQQYLIPRADHVYGDVEVKTDGSTVKTELQGGKTGLFYRLSGC